MVAVVDSDLGMGAVVVEVDQRPLVAMCVTGAVRILASAAHSTVVLVAGMAAPKRYSTDVTVGGHRSDRDVVEVCDGDYVVYYCCCCRYFHHC